MLQNQIKETMMLNLMPHCLVCERTEQTTPLLQLTYQGKTYWICPQHLPTLIHKPAQLAEKLPGMDLSASE
jgi:hypothetical protein